jgi:hypothetical protein
MDDGGAEPTSAAPSAWAPMPKPDSDEPQ